MKTPPFGMPWMPWMMPWAQQEPQQYTPDLAVPPRVRQALEFLALLSQKTAQRAAACENSIEIIEGQILCGEEENARDSACVCLARYFDGKLPLDQWEKLRYESTKQRVKTGGRDGAILRCIACGSTAVPKPDCELCRGTGRVFVSSFGGNDLMISEEEDESGGP